MRIQVYLAEAALSPSWRRHLLVSHPRTTLSELCKAPQAQRPLVADPAPSAQVVQRPRLSSCLSLQHLLGTPDWPAIFAYTPGIHVSVAALVLWTAVLTEQQGRRSLSSKSSEKRVIGRLRVRSWVIVVRCVAAGRAFRPSLLFVTRRLLEEEGY